MKLLHLILFLYFIQFIRCYRYYLHRLPNPNLVPCSLPDCSSEFQYCDSLGHSNCVYNQGNRNGFGNDFQSGSKMWTLDFCKKDSDGDGLTNGDELGDPCCEWNLGDTPRSKNVSHPGDKNSTTGLTSCLLDGFPGAVITLNSANFDSATNVISISWIPPTASCTCSYRTQLSDSVGVSLGQIVTKDSAASICIQPTTTFLNDMTLTVVISPKNLAGSYTPAGNPLSIVAQPFVNVSTTCGTDYVPSVSGAICQLAEIFLNYCDLF